MIALNQRTPSLRSLHLVLRIPLCPRTDHLQLLLCFLLLPIRFLTSLDRIVFPVISFCLFLTSTSLLPPPGCPDAFRLPSTRKAEAVDRDVQAELMPSTDTVRVQTDGRPFGLRLPPASRVTRHNRAPCQLILVTEQADWSELAP